MRQLVAACVFGGFAGLAAASASAMPIAPPPGLDDGNLTLIAQGCGPGGFRGPYGGCHYGAAPRAVYVAPHRGPYYGPRPYGAHPYYGHPRVYGAPGRYHRY